MNDCLVKIASSVSSAVEKRLFAEYGAVFATIATPPPTIIFRDPMEVNAFQSSLSLRKTMLGNYEIQLQELALSALLEAAAEAADSGLVISARAADSGARSYEDTVGLWLRNVTRGLDHWEIQGRITAERAQSLRELTPADQVGVILDIEENEGLFFGTFLDRSILYSVAAPGASQHLSMLAFDVMEYEETLVEATLARHGWYRTVPNDLPHFTYLGRDAESLLGVGLQRIERPYGEKTYGFWIPNLDRLPDGLTPS